MAGYGNQMGYGNQLHPAGPPSLAQEVSQTWRGVEELRAISVEFPHADLQAATQNFSASRLLGKGAFGAVYKGEMRDGSLMAVKLIDLKALGGESVASGFEDEIATLSKFRHANLITLMGWGRHDMSRFLIYEFLSGGDVIGRLEKCKTQGGKPFPCFERFTIALDAATGLAYLHNAKPHAFHRDIKTANILIGDSGAKMADFGLSCVAQGKGGGQQTGQGQAAGTVMQCVGVCGTPGYICPIYASTGRITEGSEVYSMGIVLLELLLNLLPAVMLNGGGLGFPIRDLVRPEEPMAMQRALSAVDRSGAYPPEASGQLAQLALQCINYSDVTRPKFNDVCKALRSIKEGSATQGPWQPGRPPGPGALPSPGQGPGPGPGGGPGWGPQAPTWGPQAPTWGPQPSPRSTWGPPGTAQSAGPQTVVLEVLHAFTWAPGSMPPQMKTLRLKPSATGTGLSVAQFGSSHHGQWCQDVLRSADAVADTINDTHFEVSWDSSSGWVNNPVLRRIGKLPMFVDNAPIRPGPPGVSVRDGSQVTFKTMNGATRLVVAISFSGSQSVAGPSPQGQTYHSNFEVQGPTRPMTRMLPPPAYDDDDDKCCCAVL